MMSEHINEITLALSKAQGEMHDPEKNKKGYNYNYADLAAVLEVVREPFSRNGLAIVQFTVANGEELKMVSLLSHISGQWIKSEMILVPKDSTMQELGKVMTYARRYLLAGQAGIYQADPDADDKKSGEVKVKTQAKQIAKTPVKYLTSQQILTIKGMMSDEELSKLENFYNCSVTDIPAEKYDAILNSYQKSRSKEVANV
jgi:hypothetical protein